MDFKHNFDIYDSPAMRAALGLYTGHRAPPELPPILDEDEEALPPSARKLLTSLKNEGEFDDDFV